MIVFRDRVFAINLSQSHLGHYLNFQFEVVPVVMPTRMKNIIVVVVKR